MIVCGLPGSGKTTHAKQLEASRGAIRLCPDEWMTALDIDLYDEKRRAAIEALQWRLAQDLLRLGQSAVIESGTWTRAERDRLRAAAHALGASVELHYLDAPIDVLLERIQQRNRESPPIGRGDLEHWARLFERPTIEELALFDAQPG